VLGGTCEAIERWCRDHGHRLVHLRKDIDVSGASADRPNLEQLVEQIEAGNLAGIVVAKLDRFSRWLQHGVNTLKTNGGADAQRRSDPDYAHRQLAADAGPRRHD